MKITDDELLMSEIWKIHGGSTHGRSRDTMTISRDKLFEFVRDVTRRAVSDALNEDKMQRISDG